MNGLGGALGATTVDGFIGAGGVVMNKIRGTTDEEVDAPSDPNNHVVMVIGLAKVLLLSLNKALLLKK